jgi:hypothetical protein
MIFVPFIFWELFEENRFIGRDRGEVLTFCSYPKGGPFTTKLDLKN